MNTPGGYQGLSTPRRRPLTPGRRDRTLPSFNSPASIRISRMLDTAYNATLDEELPGDITESITAAALKSTTDEYDPPRVWFQREEDRKQNDEFIRRVDEMVQELKRLIRDRKNEHNGEISELNDRKSRMTADMELLEKENSNILSALKDERAKETELSNDIASLQIKQKQASNSARQLLEKKRMLEQELAQRKSIIAEKRQVLAVQAAKNSPELAFFENQMGISIVGGERDILTFIFTYISLSEPSRPFSISMDLSQREYSVKKCSPVIADLQTHVDWLNASRDFFGFLKRIRRGFVEHYLNSTI
ncbi:kinetochore-associated Ndc80 complex subunit spc25 [Coemansia sp. RSA 989]|nr:chromosome segregation protein Spc25-domain-containing protein [Coemansia mojavensis]KAJ1739531.1 kinetochore-associated Ndc80 complex subunit spc25 [Coemansia sp. RSA 1086]KAJ1747959.1 kinetochore-associated Ndc80 complex subunit spc25 [Coemansia sp. RSA 1821]KAJ1862242.1 kinetochore-associated Ndc80 complex subunit spc25 [Coemansia sp. RSA 989]KAJ1870042.1 kinetochore-associated Ndc80 complex subunit spc25 [Coemansia sp. RSA 990]KAJ2631074.1 kinetochore-associated Ndc80 complex subunit sp